MKYLFILCGMLFLAASCTNKKENESSENTPGTKDTLALAHVNMIANLTDSLQPKTIDLDKVPKPLKIAVPKAKGNSYSITNSKGEVRKIYLEPPVIKLLPVLEDEIGRPIKDKAGNNFILGYGGHSNFTSFTSDNGLALDAVTCSIMDEFGNLWFGTRGGGVSRYDGKSFTNFTIAQGLVNNAVWRILEDKTGNLWFGTDGGVSRYDGKSFINFTIAQGLANNTVVSIAEDETGNLWFGTYGSGVSCYNGKSFITFSTTQGLANNRIFCIAADKKGNLWFGTDGGGVSRYNGKSFTTFSTVHGLAGDTIMSIALDKKGNLWFGTYGDGVSCFNGKSFTTYSTGQGLANNIVRCITEDKSGNLWFGTHGNGISCYDGKSFVSFTRSQGLPNNLVVCITEDKKGNLWFGTEGGGVSRYSGKSLITFSTAQGLANNIVTSIAEDKKGNLWFGTYSGGVSCFDGKSFTTFLTAQGLVTNWVVSIAEDKTGNLWLGTLGSGAILYDGKSYTSFCTDQGLVNNWVVCITEDKKGNLWFGTSGGVSRYDGKSFTNFTVAQGLVNNTIWSIAIDKRENLWFGTDGGVSRYDGKSFANFTIAQGLANNVVNSIAEDTRGNLWFGTAEGLSVMSTDEVRRLEEKSVKIKGKNIHTARILKTFTKKDGLPDNIVTQVIHLPYGKMAIGTNLGITLFDPVIDPSGDITSLAGIEIYNSFTGYPVKDVGAMYLDSKGIMWTGTGSDKTALVRFDPSAIHTNNNAPTLTIQSIKINEENICWNDLMKKSENGNQKSEFGKEKFVKSDIMNTPANITEEVTTLGKALTEAQRDSMRLRFGDIRFNGITKFYPVPQNLVLPYEHNNLTVEFGAIEVGSPNMVSYQYILEGYDKNWSPVLKKTSATFGNINEGNYTFKVKARGSNGVWCEPVTYAFKVLPPWYRTWWAYAFYVMSFILASVMFIKWRERTLKERQKILENTIKERTAEVVEEKKEVEKQKFVVEKEKQRSDELLLNILPDEVAEELKQKGKAEARYFNEVTVMFTDFKGFTQISEKLSPAELVAEIDICFKAFDNIITKHNIEKIKTIGDSYMCAGGLPVANTTNAIDVVNAALEIQQFMKDHQKQRKNEKKESFENRIGIHSGPVVAGIVGSKKFAYDIWGDTVNIASRMESSGEAGKVNISATTYELVKDQFYCTHRGKIQAKHKGEIDMYFVEDTD